MTFTLRLLINIVTGDDFLRWRLWGKQARYLREAGRGADGLLVCR